MTENGNVKPYLIQIRDWKIQCMVKLYLESKEKFKTYQGMLRSGAFMPFEKLREISEILYEIKEDHHLLYKRLIDPKKNRFEEASKFMPNKVDLEFMNNIGLLFHKVMAALEIKYLMEHYVDQSDTFQRSKNSLQEQIDKIDALFKSGIEIVKSLIAENTDNVLLLTLLLENNASTRNQFGKGRVDIVAQFGNGSGLEEVYFKAAQHYLHCGWTEKAKKMFRSALKMNPDHELAQLGLQSID